MMYFTIAMSIIAFLLIIIASRRIYFYLRNFSGTAALPEAYNTTDEWINKLGCNISIAAPQRYGKTSLALKLVYTLENDFISNRIPKEMQSFETDFYYIDLKGFKRALIDKMNKIMEETKTELKRGFISFDARKNIASELMDEFNIKNGIINNFINNSNIFARVFVYVDDYYILYYRGFDVVSKTGLYSFVRRDFGRTLMPETLNIKEVCNTGVFYLERYMIIFEDENSLNNGKMMSLDKESRDRGRKDLKCLLGNMFEETSYWINCKQNALDDVSNERVVATDNLYLHERSKTTNQYYFIRNYFENKLNKSFAKLEKYYNLKCLDPVFKEKYPYFEDFIDAPNSKVRQYNYFVKSVKDFVDSFGCVHFYVRNYGANVDSVGSNIPGTFAEVELLSPCWVCYGAYDTHEYKIAVDRLYEIASRYQEEHNTVCNAGTVASNGFAKNKLLIDSMLSFLREKEKDAMDEIKEEEPKKKYKKKEFKKYNDFEDEF